MKKIILILFSLISLVSCLGGSSPEDSASLETITTPKYNK